MSLRDDIAKQTSGKSNAKPLSPFATYLHRATEALHNPWFESDHKRTFRERYEACWRECVSPNLTADESFWIRINMAKYFVYSDPERVKAVTVPVRGGGTETAYILLDPSGVVDVSEEKRARAAQGFKPASLALPPEIPVTPQELVKAVQAPVVVYDADPAQINAQLDQATGDDAADEMPF